MSDDASFTSARGGHGDESSGRRGVTPQLVMMPIRSFPSSVKIHGLLLLHHRYHHAVLAATMPPKADVSNASGCYSSARRREAAAIVDLRWAHLR